MTPNRLTRLARTVGVIPRALQYAVLALAILIALGPTVWTVLSSFKESTVILTDPFAPPIPPSLAGYDAAITGVDLGAYLFNTFLYATCAAIICPLIALLVAYPCTRLRFPMRNAIIFGISAALAIPLVALIVPEFVVALKTGLLDTKVGLILFYSALFFPLAFVILRSFLLSVPKEVEEAAAIDGASYWRTMFSVVAPLVTPALTTVAVLVFINVWNDFLWNLVLAPGYENRNAQVIMASFQGQFTFEVSGLLAGTVMVLAVPVLIFLFAQRFAISGLAGGATAMAADTKSSAKER